jgi:preprotein translocase subunit SecE
MKKTTTENKPNPIARYLRETRGELRKVTWPTREESGRLTAIVLAVTLAFAIFLWIFDYIFSNGFRLMLSQLLGF